MEGDNGKTLAGRSQVLTGAFFCVSGMAEDAEGCAGPDAEAGYGHLVSGPPSTEGTPRDKPVQVSQTHLCLLLLYLHGHK